MRILVIGGTGFIGTFLVPELLRGGHDVAVLHRPSSVAPLIDGARLIAGDRRQLAGVADTLRAFAPDIVIDIILSSGRQARELMDVFRGNKVAAVWREFSGGDLTYRPHPRASTVGDVWPGFPSSSCNMGVGRRCRAADVRAGGRVL